MPRSKKSVATGIYLLPSGALRIELSTGRKLPDGRYEIYKETFRGTIEAAKRRRAKLIAELAEGRLKVPEKSITLGRYFEKFFEYNAQRVRLGKITESTTRFYEDSLRLYFSRLWDRPLAQVRARDVIDILAGITAVGRSTDYMLSIWRAFRAAWLAARRLKLSPPDILPDVAAMMPSPTRKRRRILQPDEVLRLLDAAEGDPITHGILACLATTAMRINECLALRWSDIDFENMVITVEQQVIRAGREPVFGPHKTFKTRGPRYIRMTAFLAEELRRVRAAVDRMRQKAGPAWREYGLVFPTAVGTPYAYSRWETDHFIPLFAAAGVPRVRVHDLRHSVVTFLIALGVPVPVVAEIAGHAEIRTTMGYTHLLVSAQDEAARKLDEAYGSVGKSWVNGSPNISSQPDEAKG